jgi:hypothetical protein
MKKLSKAIIHVYTVCKNEIEILPHIIAYYESIADKIIVFDNQSTDGSKEYIQAHPLCTLIEYDTKNELRDDIHMIIKNSAWKESIGIADWVIVSDLDEIVFHKNLLQELDQYKVQGISIPNIEGFNMISESYPITGIPITQQVRYGAYSKQFSKNLIFDPNKVVEINYTPGGHSIEPTGEIKYGGSLKLLHLKYLGSNERLLDRWNDVGKTLSKINVENNWGIERVKPEIILYRVETVKKNAELVIDNSFFEIVSRIKKIFKKRNTKLTF